MKNGEKNLLSEMLALDSEINGMCLYSVIKDLDSDLRECMTAISEHKETTSELLIKIIRSANQVLTSFSTLEETHTHYFTDFEVKLYESIASFKDYAESLVKNFLDD